MRIEESEEALPVEEEVAALIAVLRKGDPGPRDEAIERLGEIGELAVPDIEAALKSDDSDLRVDAMRGLRIIRGGPGQSPGVTGL